MKILKISIAGFGLVGQRRFSYLKKIKNIKVVGISDNFLPYRKKFKNGKVYQNYTEMFKKLKTDITFICLPNKYALQATILALKNGSHVFCEKPPARNFQEMKKLSRIIPKFKKQVLIYGFNHRYHDTIIKAKQIIKKKN